MAPSAEEELVKGMDTFTIDTKKAVDPAHDHHTDKMPSLEDRAVEPKVMTPQAAASGQRCNTCGGSFETPELYRAHFKSRWHTHNLKLKMKGLPMVRSQAEFDRLTPDELKLAETEY